MLLECQTNTNTNKNGFMLSTKCLERVLKFSYRVSIISKKFLYVCQFYKHFVLIWLALAQTLLALAHTLISLAHTLITLAHTLIAFAHTLIALAHTLIALLAQT